MSDNIIYINGEVIYREIGNFRGNMEKWISCGSFAPQVFYIVFMDTAPGECYNGVNVLREAGFDTGIGGRIGSCQGARRRAAAGETNWKMKKE